MAFPRETPRTPVSIRDISIELSDLVRSGDGHECEARYAVQVAMSDGSMVVRHGDLLPHITTAQRNSLLAFIQSMRTQANAQIIG